LFFNNNLLTLRLFRLRGLLDDLFGADSFWGRNIKIRDKGSGLRDITAEIEIEH
jgi:hypothetical protein